jgi:sulfhydrogenase subunit beta (sulfur reductase)
MATSSPWGPGSRGILTPSGVDRLISALREDGRTVLGPIARDGAICLAEVHSVADLPAGLTDEQAPGHCRLKARDDGALFGFNVGPHAFKRSLLLPEVTLVQLRRSADDVSVIGGPPPAKKLALLGARACDIAALGVQDRVLRDGPHPDADYSARRSDVLVIAVQCAQAGGTCFCVSMSTGPKATGGFDLALTEITGPEHRFVVEVGSAEGAALAERIGLSPAPDADREEAEAIVARTASQMGRSLDTTGIRNRLQSNPDDPRWDDVAARCLGCTSCTMVCPTCFCTTVEDHTDLEGTTAERTRRYDSCFSEAFAYVHGGSLRPSLRARYRQWLTHKLSTWIDQFGTSGCVGCGRCITFCPVGIDITVEAAAIGGGTKPAAPQKG